jgi:glycosyltransferase involved in cell wall biosynthesis
MKLGLNALHLVPGETGGSEIYARRLLDGLLAVDGGLEPTLFVGRGAAEGWPARASVVELPVSGRSRAARVLAEQTLLPVAVRRSRVDLLHNLFTTAPAVSAAPQVTTIHDLIYKRFPEAHQRLLTQGMRALVPLAARRSRRIVAVSQSTKDDVVRFLGVPEQRIDVTYEGPGMEETAESTTEEVLRERFGLGEAPIVLTVSAKRPHKNLERLFDAFARIEAPAVLVVPGYQTVFERDLRRRARELDPERIRFTGWLDDRDLDGLYRAATELVFPSLAEGFGLPVLEAMRRGTPVACSNTTSLPEIAGDAALYFEPTDAEAIREAIARLLSDPQLRERLAAAGRAQASKFTWEEAARRTVASYERALT